MRVHEWEVIISSCRAARPDPHNSHHTLTNPQIIPNSFNNDPIRFSCRLWIPSIFYQKSYIFMILDKIWYSARKLATPSFLYRDLLIKSTTNYRSVSFDFCEIFRVFVFSTRKLATPSILYRDLLIKSTTNSSSVSFDFCEIFPVHVFSARKLATPSILYRDLLIKSTTNSSSGISEFCEIFRDRKIPPQLHEPVTQCSRWNLNPGCGANE